MRINNLKSFQGLSGFWTFLGFRKPGSSRFHAQFANAVRSPFMIKTFMLLFITTPLPLHTTTSYLSPCFSRGFLVSCDLANSLSQTTFHYTTRKK